MKIIRFDAISEMPLSHEDPKDPGAIKRVLLSAQEKIQGRIQMINWATLLPGRGFANHKHENMKEIFIMLAGGAIAIIDGKEATLSRGDAVVVNPREAHEMKNPGETPIEYIVIGVV